MLRGGRSSGARKRRSSLRHRRVAPCRGISMVSVSTAWSAVMFGRRVAPPPPRRASVAASLVTVLRTAPSVGAGPGLVAASPLRQSRVGARSRGANPDVALRRALLRQPRGDGLSRRPARRPRSAPGDQHPQEALPSTRPSRSRPRLARLPGRLASSSRRGARSRAAPP